MRGCERPLVQFHDRNGAVAESAASHFLENVIQRKITTVEQQQKNMYI